MEISKLNEVLTAMKLNPTSGFGELIICWENNKIVWYEKREKIKPDSEYIISKKGNPHQKKFSD
jgi:hypothetical protein